MRKLNGRQKKRDEKSGQKGNERKMKECVKKKKKMT